MAIDMTIKMSRIKPLKPHVAYVLIRLKLCNELKALSTSLLIPLTDFFKGSVVFLSIDLAVTSPVVRAVLLLF
jgi:hypothetical protein